MGLRCLLDCPQGPPPSTLFASDAFLHFSRPPASLDGPQPQLRGLLSASHHPGPRGALCRLRLGLSSQSQGSFPPGTLLFWPTLSPSANSNPHVGAHQGLEMGGSHPPSRRAPWPGRQGQLCTRGGCMLLVGGQGPSMQSPSCTKRFYKDTLSSFLVYGDPQPGILCSLQGTPAGQASPDTLFNCPPTCTDPEPPPSTPPPHLSTGPITL